MSLCQYWRAYLLKEKEKKEQRNEKWARERAGGREEERERRWKGGRKKERERKKIYDRRNKVIYAERDRSTRTSNTANNVLVTLSAARERILVRASVLTHGFRSLYIPFSVILSLSKVNHLFSFVSLLLFILLFVALWTCRFYDY